jgi:hypothetical protein
MRVLRYRKDIATYTVKLISERALMTKNQLVESKETITVAVQQPTFAKRVADMIEDPFGSVIIATAITTLAIAAVLSGLWIVNVILH